MKIFRFLILLVAALLLPGCAITVHVDVRDSVVVVDTHEDIDVTAGDVEVDSRVHQDGLL